MLLIYRQNPYTAVERQDALALLIRSCSSTAAFFAVIKSIKLVPLTIFQVVTNMTPFVSGLLAFIWLGEKLSIFQIMMMILCFGGVTMVALANNSDEDHSKSNISSYEAGVALCGTLCVIFAVSAVSTRRLKGMHFSVMQFYLTFVAFIASSIWILLHMMTN